MLVEVIDVDLLLREFPALRRGFVSQGIKDINTFVRDRHSQIYDFYGLRDAVINTLNRRSGEFPSEVELQQFKNKLERYITAHLCVLELYSMIQNNDETPYANIHTQLYAENQSSGGNREGDLFSMLRSSSIGQRLIAMLTINTNNIGSVL